MSHHLSTKGTELPPSVTMAQAGDIKEFKNSAGRMVTAIGFAVILIFFTLITFFDSVKVSLMIILSIPLTIIGTFLTLLFIPLIFIWTTRKSLVELK